MDGTYKFSAQLDGLVGGRENVAVVEDMDSGSVFDAVFVFYRHPNREVDVEVMSVGIRLGKDEPTPFVLPVGATTAIIAAIKDAIDLEDQRAWERSQDPS